MMVANTNTVIYPGTVMIETLHTMTTRTTMTRAWCSYNFTVWAYKNWIKILYYCLNKIKHARFLLKMMFIKDFLSILDSWKYLKWKIGGLMKMLQY